MREIRYQTWDSDVVEKYWGWKVAGWELQASSAFQIQNNAKV